jgi:protein-S-isoprenylcysteine O-methyltransferase Ste14
MDLFLLKFTTFLTLALFTFFVSDIRSKEGMTSLIKKHIIVLIKIFYIAPILVYIYLIINMENIYFSNYAGLIANLVGTILVIKAKLDLGEYHTWAGHILSSTKIIKNGIYSYIRHPLYTGIYIFIFGGIMMGINNHPFSLLTVVIILFFVLLIILFLNISAFKEDNYLLEEFGKDYLEYKRQVHAFLPINKYSFNEDC